MYNSRVNAAQLLYERCLSLEVRPKTFISASAIGYYGHVEGHVCKESDLHGSGWLCDMCVDWEKGWSTVRYPWLEGGTNAYFLVAF